MPIQVEIFGHNLEVTENTREYITKKASRLDHFLDELKEVRVDLEYLKSIRNSENRMVAQITTHARKAILRTEERADDLLAAFDSAIDKMQRQLERYKGKHRRGRRNGKPVADVVNQLTDEGLVETPPTIVRKKSIKISPMKEADALEQMRMLGHDNFFIFFNIETNSTAVLYRRRDGTYGVIDVRIG